MALYTKCSVCRKKIPRGTVCDCNKERYKEYNKRVRYQGDNKKFSEFYNSSAWHKLSSYINRKYNGLCVRCLINHNKIVPNDVIHHIDELRENFDKRLDEGNLIPLCHSCHNELHSNYTSKAKVELRMMLTAYEKKYI